jgi:hypothetical protein
MSKIATWFMNHRTAIGYTIGFANILSGLANIALGNVVGGLFWTVIGAIIVYDVRTNG